MTTTIKLLDGDLKAAQFIFAYFQYYGVLPTLQEMSEKLGYTRQAANYYKGRLVKLGALDKAGRGEYSIKGESLMPRAFQEVFDYANKQLYISLYMGIKKA